jgi:type VI secretion system protein ImpL
MLRSETAGPDTKAIARSIVLGEPNDLMQGVKTTDSLVQKLDSELRESVLSLLVEPWLMAMRGVLARAKADIDRRWETDVYQACQRSIEPRYPFRLTGEDAAVADVVDFFHPQNGILWRFYQAELKPFIEESGEHWEPKTWHSVGMSFSEEFLSTIQQARYIAESLFIKGAPDMGTIFEVYPYPPQGLASRAVSEIRLEIGGQPLRYRMEPQEWQEIKWPGSTTASGVSLQVQVGNAWVTKDYKGIWGLFKLITAGRVAPGENDALVKVQWDLQAPDSRSIQVKYDLRGQSYKNPFRPGMFQKFRCIQHL